MFDFSANKRQILHVALFLPNLGGGGAERVMVNLASGFAKSGLKVDIVLARAEGPYLSLVPPEVRIVNLHARRTIYSLPRLIHYLRRERPEGLLSTLSHANIVAIWARALACIPFQLAIRETTMPSLRANETSTVQSKLMLMLIRLFYRYADAVVANSQGVAEDLKKFTKLREQKLRVIYNPVIRSDLFSKAEEKLEHPWFAPGQPPVILGVGRLIPQKGFEILIRAFAIVRKERSARLMILGEGEERPKLENLVLQLGLKNEVLLPGFVENPYKYMKNAAVFVLNSRLEGLPSVLIEAMALGTPVVSTNCPSGPAEILEGGKWGRLVPVGDQETLARAILDSLQAIRSPVPESAWKRFLLMKVVSEYLEVLGSK